MTFYHLTLITTVSGAGVICGFLYAKYLHNPLMGVRKIKSENRAKETNDACD